MTTHTVIYTYPAAGQARPHAATAAGGSAYVYNAAGDMTSRTENGVTYTQQWDVEHRLTQVTNTSVTPNRITKFYYNPSASLRAS